MAGVFPLSPFPVFQNPNQQAIHANATITANGSQVLTGYGVTEVTLFINVKAAPTGTLPTLQYTVQEVDPGDGVTPIGAVATSTSIVGPGIQRITLASTFGGSIQVSWGIGGTGSPTFTQVYATLVGKGGTFSLVDGTGSFITGANPLDIAVRDDVRSSSAVRSSVAASSTDVLLLSADASRRSVLIYNDSDAPLHVALGVGPATLSDFSFQISSRTLGEVPIRYVGDVRGVWEQATGNALITVLT